MIYDTCNVFVLSIYRDLEGCKESIESIQANGFTIEQAGNFGFDAWVAEQFHHSKFWNPQPFDPAESIVESIIDFINDTEFCRRNTRIPEDAVNIFPALVDIGMRIYFIISHWVPTYFANHPEVMLEYVTANDYDLLIRSVR